MGTARRLRLCVRDAVAVKRRLDPLLLILLRFFIVYTSYIFSLSVFLVCESKNLVIESIKRIRSRMVGIQIKRSKSTAKIEKPAQIVIVPSKLKTSFTLITKRT